EIISVFLVQTEKDMETLRTALNNDDIETITAVAHRKLTMTRQIMASEVVPILEQLELTREANATLEALMHGLEKAISDLVTDLENETR
ncbi:MAG: hypothetical protein R3359_07715, partial [Marinirhabdus sp.]|nr:hypothetical protein [Marinirhabdus sp.]